MNDKEDRYWMKEKRYAMYEKYFNEQYSREEFYRLNEEICKKIKSH